MKRLRYCEYMGKFYTYVLPKVPRDQVVDLHEKELTSMHVYESIFRAWRLINGLYWTLSTDYFSAKLVLSFQLHGKATVNELEELNLKQYKDVAEAFDLVQYYVHHFQDGVVRGSGNLWEYLVDHTASGERYKCVVPTSSFVGALDLITDTEEPYLKFVVTNVMQWNHLKEEWIHWKVGTERFPVMETLMDGYYLHKELNKKSNGWKFAKCGVQVLENYHERGMTVHPWEAAKLNAVRANLETALAKAVSLEESDKRNNAGSH